MKARRLLVVYWILTTLFTAWGLDPGGTKVSAGPPPSDKSASPTASPIAVTAAAAGEVLLVDRGDLRLLRTVKPEKDFPTTGGHPVKRVQSP
jgi:hypothetical protein